MQKIILALILSLNVLYANTIDMNNYTPDQIKKDFNTQDTAKYKEDSLQVADMNTLIQSKVLVSNFTGENNDSTAVNCSAYVQNGYTATVYDVNPRNGVVECMYANVGDLYHPIGLFSVFYPKLKAQNEPNLVKAKVDNANIIQKKDEVFATLKTEKQQISNQTQQVGNYLTIPQLLTAGILSDANIIDAQQTELTGKLELKDNFTSKIYNQNGQEIGDNGKYIKEDIASIFKNYASISQTSMEYLYIITAFMVLFGVGRLGLSKFDKSAKEPHVFWGAGVLAGVLLFFPFNDHQDIGNSNQSYAMIQTKWMQYERSGYYLFGEYADKLAKNIIDNELDTLINKSGIGTSQQIANSAADITQYQKLVNYTLNMKDECKNIYVNLASQDPKNLFGTPNSIYPKSEKWAYAVGNYSTALNYYNIDPNGLVSANAASPGYYPKYSISSCERNDIRSIQYGDKLNDFKSSFRSAIQLDPQQDKKIGILKTLMKFQYGLYRDWGYLSILGLPVIKMQTEYIGGLYQKDDVTQKLDEQISGNSITGKFLNSFFSSIPYMLVPGASSIYGNTISTLRDLAKGVEATGVGRIAGLWGGNIVASAAANMAGFAISYTIVKVLLSLLPIIGIVIIGLLRFIIIMIKIFSFHFGSLLILPIIFIKNNVGAISKFFIKILLLFFELPIFVLSIWLAMAGNSLLHSIGDVFSKQIIIGMLQNNQAAAVNDWSFKALANMNFTMINSIKIYFFNGLMEVVISLFSIVIIYKILISLHTMLFDALELKGTETLDHAIEGMRNEVSVKGNI